jgi:DNA-binding MarR family transcriptional regulator
VIADRLALESSTVTPLVQRLAAAGTIERRRNPDDGRQVQVWLTAKGRNLRERCGCLAEGLLAAAGLKPERLAALNRDVKELWVALRTVGPGD